MQHRPLNKIMYVEDEVDIIDIVQIALEDLGGFKVKSCTSGKEALQLAPSFQPDLFLIDVMMPEMDGPTTLKKLRQLPAFAKTPVIFMTARAQATEIREYIESGAIGVITKPFDPMKLAESITKIWQENANYVS